MADLFNLIQLGKTGAQGIQASQSAKDLRKAATKGIEQQTDIAGRQAALTEPLATEGAGFLSEVIQGGRPDLLKRIIGPQTGVLARQFGGAREAIASRVNRGGARQRLLSNSFTDEARARTALEGNAASNALNSALGIGFRVPIQSANIFGQAAGSNVALAGQAGQRASQAGGAFGNIIDQKFP